MDYPFFAYLDRLKLIRRWGLMRNTESENDMEHSMQTAVIAHGLAMLGRERFGRQVDPERVTVIALYHDASEAITGDLPDPYQIQEPCYSGRLSGDRIHGPAAAIGHAAGGYEAGL